MSLSPWPPPGCDGASVLASARGGSREPGRQSSDRRGCSRRSDGDLEGHGGSRVRGSASTHIPAVLLFPEAATAAEIRNGLGEMGRQERLHSKLGAGWEWLRFHFLRCVNGHNALKPSCDTAPAPGQSPGSHHGMIISQETSWCREAKGHRGVAAFQVDELVLSHWRSAQINCFSVQFSCSRILHSKRETFQTAAIFLSHSSCCFCTSQRYL